MEAVLSLRNNRAFGAELVMPMNAIALDNDEMEYVDGGQFYNSYWWGVSFNFSRSQCADISQMLTMGAGAGAIATAIGSASGLAPGVALGILTGIITIEAGMFGLAGNHNGMTVSYNWIIGGIMSFTDPFGGGFISGISQTIHW